MKLELCKVQEKRDTFKLLENLVRNHRIMVLLELLLELPLELLRELLEPQVWVIVLPLVLLLPA